MPTNFAVIDVGSNAMRFQVASVEQPGLYRIVEQDRRPVRLGHKVFETGSLDKTSRTEGLETLRRFKSIADKHGVAALRAVATSAMREASDGQSFIEEAGTFGVPVEILSEKEEARMISLGILSGLKFDLPLGLFMDIGGGSVEIAVGNRESLYYISSLPLGAVRLTERYIRRDPPGEREIAALRGYAQSKLVPVAKRISREKFTMAFGSGGTVTALADADSRMTGEPHQESLYVLRRGRLKSLFDLLRSQHLKERSAGLIGDPKRADILVAGAAVLLAMMDEMELDYVFVSRRGLKDGLMVDLLSRNYTAYTGPWSEAEVRSESLEEVGEKYNYDAAHCRQVSRLAQMLFEQLRDLHRLADRYIPILHAAAMLHDIGLFIGYEKHHKHSYYLIKSSGPSSFGPMDLDMIAVIARYHRKGHPTPKHLPFSQLSPVQQDVVRKLSGILRLADALDFGHQSKVQEISCRMRSRNLTIKLSGSGDLRDEINRAMEKVELMNELFGIDIHVE
jgi:exopolyphosphatase/guanosine-5'-triphosphate,3'-diphosphate pyrophosphatase